MIVLILSQLDYTLSFIKVIAEGARRKGNFALVPELQLGNGLYSKAPGLE
jgi:hypothetical protein